tara:strand:- start:76 stop:264 length:189 start_codon:yes stop_codon:yes gene_type:complete
MKEKVDIILSKWISRKLMVFVVACFGLFSGVLTSTDWTILATAYVGMVGFYEIVTKLKNKIQ